MTRVMEETQEQRDVELHELTGVSLEEIKGYKIAAPEFIKIYGGDKEPETEKEFISLYENYKFMNFTGYLKTLMHTSVHGRERKLIQILRDTHNQTCLDFGSGVGTHTIALMENDNKVEMLDVKGPLLFFAVNRIWDRNRMWEEDLASGFTYYPEDDLPENKYDLIICVGVLEHVFDPMKELDRMRIALKQGGRLYAEVSHMVKMSSGHFSSSIKQWQLRSPAYLSMYFDYENGEYIKK